MSRSERKFVLDTNLFISGLRQAEAKARLQAFHSAFAPFEYLSAVVVHELRAGTKGGEDLRSLERHILEPFERRGRVLTPSYPAWSEAGDVLRDLARAEGGSAGNVRSLANDVLLALSCREAGVTLVTENLRDFRRIRRLVPFEFVPPWPTPIDLKSFS